MSTTVAGTAPSRGALAGRGRIELRAERLRLRCRTRLHAASLLRETSWREPRYYGAGVALQTEPLVNPDGATAPGGSFVDDEMWLADTTSPACTTNVWGACWVETGYPATASSRYRTRSTSSSPMQRRTETSWWSRSRSTALRARSSSPTRSSSAPTRPFACHSAARPICRRASSSPAPCSPSTSPTYRSSRRGSTSARSLPASSGGVAPRADSASRSGGTDCARPPTPSCHPSGVEPGRATADPGAVSHVHNQVTEGTVVSDHPPTAGWFISPTDTQTGLFQTICCADSDAIVPLGSVPFVALSDTGKRSLPPGIPRSSRSGGTHLPSARPRACTT